MADKKGVALRQACRKKYTTTTITIGNTVGEVIATNGLDKFAVHLSNRHTLLLSQAVPRGGLSHNYS